jgi:hypothetical protein
MYAPMSELRRSASVEVPAQIEFDEVEMGLLADQEEQRPLIGSGGDEGLGGKGVAPDTNEWAVACLLLQHVSRWVAHSSLSLSDLAAELAEALSPRRAMTLPHSSSVSMRCTGARRFSECGQES